MLGVPRSDKASWRQLAEMGKGGTFWMVYPGRQAEDPTSPHYEDQFPLGRDGRCVSILFGERMAPAQSVRAIRGR